MLKIIRKADIVLFFVLVAFGLALSIPGITTGINLGNSSQGSTTQQGASAQGLAVVITSAGESYGTYPLDEDTEIKINHDGHLNNVIIKDGTVQMQEASCHNQVCVKQGIISRVNESIICLPNRVVVRIVNEGIDNDIGGEVDVISG